MYKAKVFRSINEVEKYMNKHRGNIISLEAMGPGTHSYAFWAIFKVEGKLHLPINSGKLDYICSFFEHAVEPHKHLCRNKKNCTFRCGYSYDDWMDCPISS